MKHPTVSCPWDDENCMGTELEQPPNISSATGDSVDVSSVSAGTTAEPIATEDTPEKVEQTQLISGDLIAMNSELAQKIFHQSPAEWSDTINNKHPIVVVEDEPRSVLTKNGWKSVSKPIAEVSARLAINNNVKAAVEQCLRNQPLDPFDKIVLEACATHQYLGRWYITVNTIFKYMGGDGEPSSKMRDLIIDSVDKLRGLDIRIDATDAYKKLERLQRPIGTPKRPPDKYGRIVLVDNLLSAKRLEIEVDGHILDAIKFKDVSPIFLYTQDKGETQVLEKKFLAASRLRATKNFIALKSYILCRLRSMSRSKKGGGAALETTLVWDTLYRNCGDPDRVKTDRMFRKRLRDATVEYLTALVEQNEISSFCLVDKNNCPCTNLADSVKIRVTFPTPQHQLPGKSKKK